MKTKAVHYEDEEIIVDLVISSATVLIGAKKFRIAQSCEEAIGALDSATGLVDTDFRIIALGVYPSMTAPVVEWKAALKASGESIPVPTLEAFVQLPEALWDAWSIAVYELNPHWIPKAPENSERARVQGEEDLKKVEDSTNELNSP